MKERGIPFSGEMVCAILDDQKTLIAQRRYPTTSEQWHARMGAREDLGRYRHARFMPRWASRITLEITEVRAQRLEEISEEDAQAEGVARCHYDAAHPDVRHHGGCMCHLLDVPRPFACSYFALWVDINGADADANNPWVWAITFKRIDARAS